MAHVSSDSIKVFPSIGRIPDIDADDELMNEGNISNLVRSLCRTRKSYVLSTQWTTPFEFVIYGFYFKLTNLSSLPTKSLYAHITLKENTGNYQLLTLSNSTVSNNSLQCLDQNTEHGLQFQGVWFDSQSTGGTYDLQLLDDNGHIPATSLLHVKTNEILDGESSNYINNSFTTTLLTTSSLTTTSLTTTSLNTTNATIGTLTVDNGSTLKGAVTVSSTLTVTGSTSLASTTISTLTVTGQTTLSTLSATGINPITTGQDLGNSGLRWTLYADSVNTSGDIVFPEVSESNTSPSIRWSGGTDNASIYYSLPSSDQGELNFKLADDTGVAFNFIIDGTSNGTPNHKVVTITDSNVNIDANVTAAGKTITASTFSGSLNGNFTDNRTFSFSDGDISGSTSSNTGGYSITASIIDGKVVESKIADDAVTTNKIKDKNVTNSKIDDNTIKKAKLGFDVTMTLTVSNGVLIINTPSLEDKN